jgi:hypothetical protein
MVQALTKWRVLHESQPLLFEMKPMPRSQRAASKRRQRTLDFGDELRAFKEFGTATREIETSYAALAGTTKTVPTFVNEFWTARQRQAEPLHEISYRACFKPQLPRFFIERLTEPGDVVYDPFMGRGTTLLEAALLGRKPAGNDVNPLSAILIGPRLTPPTLEDIAKRLREIPFSWSGEIPEELLVFYHPETLRKIMALRHYFLSKASLDDVDRWIRMVAVNRLTGHSNGFFSVYTLPPNQAVSVKSQRKINQQRNQIPPPRDLSKIILKKSRILLGETDLETLRNIGSGTRLCTGPASSTSAIPSDSVSLVVTSPPFLNVVDYATDNWLRCWFVGIDAKSVKLTVPRKLEDWEAAMTEVFVELKRLLRPGGHVAFEVGEVNRGRVKLEESVLACAERAGLRPLLVLINDQKFTKTANCWGVDNNSKGTNTNRIALLRKDA